MSKVKCVFLLLILLQVGNRVGHAQPYENLVFEGAGIRGIAYVGALEVLKEQQVLSSIKRVGGTSAGAITAMVVSLGYEPQEIRRILTQTKLQSFNDGRFFFVGGVHRLNKRYGWYRGKSFQRWLDKLITAKTGDARITFRQLHDRGFKDLYITGTSLNQQRLVVFSYTTYPDMAISDAVRISMSIPLYFEAVCIDAHGRVKDCRNLTATDDLMVDGGFTGNFPIDIFDDRRATGERIPNPATLGLRMDRDEQIQYDTTGRRQLAPVPIQGLKPYVGAFYNYVLESLNRGSLTEADWQRTVSISSGTVGPRIRRMPTAEQDVLIASGRAAVRAYLKRQTLTP